MTTDFDKEALRIKQKCVDDRHASNNPNRDNWDLIYAHAIRDLVLQGSAEPVVSIISKNLFYAWDGNNKMHCVVPVEIARQLERNNTRPQLPPEQQEELERLHKRLRSLKLTLEDAFSQTELFWMKEILASGLTALDALMIKGEQK